jgi:hypothetical protein
VGFTVFRAATIGVNRNSEEYHSKMFFLIGYQTIMFVDLAKLYLKGLTLTDDIPGVEKEDYKIENEFIHITRIVLLVQGVILTGLMFLFIVLFLLLLCTVVTFSYYQGNVRRRQQQQRAQSIINVMNHFPFGNVLFQGVTECPICLLGFSEDDEAGNP